MYFCYAAQIGSVPLQQRVWYVAVASILLVRPFFALLCIALTISEAGLKVAVTSFNRGNCTAQCLASSTGFLPGDVDWYWTKPKTFWYNFSLDKDHIVVRVNCLVAE
jgi:hypothetical protein